MPLNHYLAHKSSIHTSFKLRAVLPTLLQTTHANVTMNSKRVCVGRVRSNSVGVRCIVIASHVRDKNSKKSVRCNSKLSLVENKQPRPSLWHLTFSHIFSEIMSWCFAWTLLYKIYFFRSRNWVNTNCELPKFSALLDDVQQNHSLFCCCCCCSSRFRSLSLAYG